MMSDVSIPARRGTQTFVRYAMVVSAFVFPLGVAVALFTSPFDPTSSRQEYVQEFKDNIDGYGGFTYWLFALGVIAQIPALFGVSKVARAGKPLLGLIAMILAFALALPVQVNTDDVIYAALKNNLDVSTVVAIVKTLEDDSPSSVLGGVFFLGLLGLLLLGVAVLLGRTAPLWAAIALMVGAVLIPVPWIAGLGSGFAGFAWLVLAAGMGGVALSLLGETPAAGMPSRESTASSRSGM